jgi:hypothetical protein
MAPIVIGEFITDPAKRWRAVHLAAVGTAVAYEALHTVRELPLVRLALHVRSARKTGRKC